jgi:RNA polymerase sigma-70 factor (ECF subfamily)
VSDRKFEVLFRRLFELHFCNLKAHARHYTGSPEIADDIVQDAFMQLWEKRESFDFEGAVKSWLYQTVHHKCINHLKHQQVEGRFRASVQLKLREAELCSGEFQDQALDELTDEEFTTRLKTAIDTLPLRCREAFLLSRQRGLSNQQIAAEMSITLKAVERNMTRALTALRQAFRDLIK